MQAFRYELTLNDKTRARFASHCGASRFAFNWGLALVKRQLAMREQIRQACFRELLTDEETDALVQTIEIPWSMYTLRKEWNREKRTVAPWWAAHSKFAYESGNEVNVLPWLVSLGSRRQTDGVRVGSGHVLADDILRA